MLKPNTTQLPNIEWVTLQNITETYWGPLLHQNLTDINQLKLQMIEAVETKHPNLEEHFKTLKIGALWVWYKHTHPLWVTNHNKNNMNEHLQYISNPNSDYFKQTHLMNICLLCHPQQTEWQIIPLPNTPQPNHPLVETIGEELW